MQLTFLGTGGGLPSPRRGVSAAAVQIGRDVVLFDCGEGTQRQFMLSSVSFMKISHVFITHFHGDHFLGLPGLLQSMSFSRREEPIWICGPEGMVELTRTVLELGYFDPGYEIIAQAMRDGDMIDIGDHTVLAVKADHTVPALSYVLQEKPLRGKFLAENARALGVPEGPMFGQLQSGRSVKLGERTISPDMVMGPPRPGRKIVISGDTRPTKALITAAKDADVLVHEATLDSTLEEGAIEYGHSTARDAGIVAFEANVGTLFLTHISNRYEDPTVLVEEAKEAFKNTILAEDLMTFQITKDRNQGEQGRS